MKVHYQIVASALIGVVVGTAAIQGLQAQGKPKAYLVTETQILDDAAAIAVSQKVGDVIRTAGGRTIISARGKITAVEGAAPIRFGVSEWESMEKVQAYLNLPEREALAPEYDRAINNKIVRRFIIEEFQNMLAVGGGARLTEERERLPGRQDSV
jgi:uncharacterized protein (DUF1330 family)